MITAHDRPRPLVTQCCVSTPLALPSALELISSEIFIQPRLMQKLPTQ